MSETEPRAERRAARLESLRIDREAEPATPAGSRWSWPLAGVLVVAAGAAALWWWSRPGAVSVTIEPARAAVSAPAVASVLDATGYVTARRAATVSAEITGKVREVLIEEGQAVAAGDVLAYLDDSTERAQLELAAAQFDSARAALAEIRAQLAEADHNLARTTELARRQLASQKDLDAAQATAATLSARLQTGEENVKVAQRTVALRRQQLDEYVIRAPFAGVVIDKSAQPGEMISPISAGGGFTRTGICTIVDMDSLEIEVDVNEAYIQRVRAGQRVSAVLDAYPDWRVPAEVIAIVPAADREKATVRVRIGFVERDQRILPDMGVKVAFLESGGPPADAATAGVLVPREALRGSGEDRYVFVVAGGVAARRSVQRVQQSAEGWRIGAGLSAGEQVVVRSSQELSDGDRVEQQ